MWRMTFARASKRNKQEKHPENLHSFFLIVRLKTTSVMITGRHTRFHIVESRVRSEFLNITRPQNRESHLISDFPTSTLHKLTYLAGVNISIRICFFPPFILIIIFELDTINIKHKFNAFLYLATKGWKNYRF